MEPVVENIIMYIPVEEETEGGTPMLNKTGLNTAPPPRPRAPETQPPINPKVTIFITLDLSNLMSLEARPKPPNLALRSYSRMTFLIENIHNTAQSTRKRRSTIQSRTLHLSMPMMDSNFLILINLFIVTCYLSVGS